MIDVPTRSVYFLIKPFFDLILEDYFGDLKKKLTTYLYNNSVVVQREHCRRNNVSV